MVFVTANVPPTDTLPPTSSVPAAEIPDDTVAELVITNVPPTEPLPLTSNVPLADRLVTSVSPVTVNLVISAVFKLVTASTTPDPVLYTMADLPLGTVPCDPEEFFIPTSVAKVLLIM